MTRKPLQQSDIDYLASVDRLLVAMDFDGTLAHFSDSPTDVRAVPGAIEALQDLATLPGVRVLLISGRELAQLTAVTGLTDPHSPAPTREGQVNSESAGTPPAGHASENQAPTASDRVMLCGSHGAEPSRPLQSHGAELTSEQQDDLTQLGSRAEELATSDPGLWVEYKPYSVGLHYRTASDLATATKAVSLFGKFAETLKHAHITHGRDILEISVSGRSKGSYLAGLRAELDDPVVVFAGDDVTDETALQTLRFDSDQPDVGIHVGGRLADTTHANRSLGTPEDVRDFLVSLLVARRSSSQE